MFTPDRFDERSPGSLHMRFGPMWAKKTTWLNMVLTTHADLGSKVLKIMSIKDKRPTVEKPDGSTHHSSYFGLTPKIEIMCTQKLSNLDISQYNIIGIEEGHFFQDIYDTVINWVRVQNKHIFLVGLDGDINQKPFIELLKLIPHADSAEKLTAHCKLCIAFLEKCNFKGDRMCSRAPFTRKVKADDQYLNSNSDSESESSYESAPKLTDKSDPLVQPGGPELYEPVCSYHLYH